MWDFTLSATGGSDNIQGAHYVSGMLEDHGDRIYHIVRGTTVKFVRHICDVHLDYMMLAVDLLYW